MFGPGNGSPIATNVLNVVLVVVLLNAFFNPKNKKTFVNVIKNVTLFLLAFDIEPVNKITDIN